MLSFQWIYIFILVLGHHVLPKTQDSPDASLQIKNEIENNLFDQEDILDFTLKGNLKTLFKDRGDNPSYHPITISYVSTGGETIDISLKAKTRGRFRRSASNCVYPPILLNFSKKKTPPNSLFQGQDKLKLVVPCRDDRYVVREYLVYKLYNLLTEYSFKARLVRVVYMDEEKGKTTDPLFGVLIEDEDEMALRNQMKILKQDYLKPKQTDGKMFLTMALFQYMIGNTDWSIQYRQNIKLLQKMNFRTPIPVPYDFDHAGIVSTPYAKPAPELQLQSIRVRRYRGYCINSLQIFDSIIAEFNSLREDFYQIYEDCPYVEEKYVKNTLKFLNEFYETINDEKKRKEALLYPCEHPETANIVIKGLRE